MTRISAAGAVGVGNIRRLKTEILTTRKNLKSLMDVPGKWIDRVRQGRSWDKLVLDVTRGAPGVGQTYGRREGTP